jgi:hypothetical protein
MPKVKMLGALHAALGAIGLLASGIILADVARDPGAREAPYFAMIVLFFSAVYFLPAFAGGIGLLKGYRWARPVIIAVSCVLLVAFPVGTVIGAAGLWILLGRMRA